MYTNGLAITGAAAGAPAPAVRAAGGGTGQSGDRALIAAVRAGRRSAVGVLYGMYRTDALGLARSLLRNDHDAEDVLHEAFTKTIKAIDNGYGPSENFLAYLYTAVKATAAGWWKTNLRVVPVEAGGLEQGQFHDGRLEAVLDRTDNERILQALKSLPVHWQTVLWYADVLQEPPRRIAPLMGIAPNAVSALVARARKGLRSAYLDTLNDQDKSFETEKDS